MLKKKNWFPSAFLMSCAHFVSDMYPGFLAPLLPLLMLQHDFSITFAGIIASVSSFANSFTQPLFGYLSDRFNRRIFVIFGPLLSAVFYCSIGFMPNKWWLIACVFIGGLGVAQFHPQAAMLTNQISDDKKDRTMSVFAVGGTVGYPFGALIITTVILPLWGLKFAPVLIIPAVVMIFFMIRFAPRYEAPVKIPGEAEPKPSAGQLIRVGMFVTINVIRSLVILGFNVLIPIWFSLQQFTLQRGGWAVFVFHFFGGMGGLIGGFLSDRFPSRWLIFISFTSGTPFLILFMNSTGVISLIFLGIAGMLLYSSIPAVITRTQSAMPARMGIVSSLVMGFSWGVGALLVLAASRIADVYGVELTMNYLAYAPLLAAFLALFIRPLKTQQLSQPVCCK